MARITTLALIIIAVLAGTAQADYLKGNPKVCKIAGTAQTATYCAQQSAIRTFKAHMAKKTGQPSWDADISCSSRGSLLRWACTWKAGSMTGQGTVTFKATSAGWRRVSTG